MSTINSLRIVSVAPRGTLKKLLGGAEPPFVGVSLLKPEYMRSATAIVTTVLPGHPQVLHPLRFDQFRPVSFVEIDFCGPVPLVDTTMAYPAYATVDAVAVVCRIEWSAARAELDAIGQRAREPHTFHSERAFAASLASMIDRVANDVEAVSGRVLAEMNVAARDVRSRTRRLLIEWGLSLVGKWKPEQRKRWEHGAPRGWTSEIAATKAATQALAEETAAVTSIDGAVALANSFRDHLDTTRPRFLISTNIDASGVIDLAPLRRCLRTWFDAEGIATADAVATSVVVPFTTESEPGTQGKRSSFVLALLAAAMLGVAFVDLSWVPRQIVDLWPWALDLSGPSAEWSLALVDPLVAVLLLFPAVLYAQFFQTRPRTDLGNRAQLGMFAALSIIFALPILPAVLTADGTEFRVVSKAACAVALVAATGAIVVWRTFTNRSLTRLRVDVILNWSVARTKGGQ